MAHHKENYWWDLWVTFFIRETYVNLSTEFSRESMFLLNNVMSILFMRGL